MGLRFGLGFRTAEKTGNRWEKDLFWSPTPASLPSEPQELSGGLELSFSSTGFPKADKAMPKFTKSELLTFLFKPCQIEMWLIGFILE